MTPRRLRILQVLTCDAIGGTELMVATLVRRLDPERFAPEVALLDRPGPIAAMVQEAGVPVHVLGRAGSPRTALRMAALLRRRRYDVVHAYGFKGPQLLRLVARVVSPRPAVVAGVQGLTPADRDDVDGPLARLLLAIERLTSPLVDVYEANSKGAVDLLARHGVRRERLRYIPNGIDVEAWPFRPRERPGAPPLVLNVSRFAARKRQRDLVLAAAELRRRGMDFGLVLAGDGPTLPEIRALVRELGMADLVTVAPAIDVPGVAALLARADVFCQPSLWEGMPATVLEAMAAGVPVVGTTVNGIVDLVDPGVTGWLAPPQQPGRLADALAEALAAPPAVRRRYAEEARRRVERGFRLEDVVAAKAALYASLRGASGPPA